MYCKSPVSLSFCILFLFLVNGPQALYVNPGYIKSISGMNLSPVYYSLIIKTCLLFIHFIPLK